MMALVFSLYRKYCDFCINVMAGCKLDTMAALGSAKRRSDQENTPT